MKFFKLPAHLTSLLLLLLACLFLPTSPAFARKEDPVRYVVTLETSREPLNPMIAVNVSLAEASRIYTTSFRRNGVTWYRLRLGFFGSRQEAEEVLAGLKSRYPSAWATRITKREKQHVIAGQIKSQPATIMAVGK